MHAIPKNPQGIVLLMAQKEDKRQKKISKSSKIQYLNKEKIKGLAIRKEKAYQVEVAQSPKHDNLS